MKSILALLFLAINLSLAQDSVLLEIAGFPACSIPCIEQAFLYQYSGCQGNNYTCICSTGATGAAGQLLLCVNKTKPCSDADEAKVNPVIDKLCTAVGFRDGRPIGNSSNSSVAPTYTTPTTPQASGATPPSSSANKIGLGIGLGIGLPVMSIIGALVGIILFRARQTRNSTGDELMSGLSKGPHQSGIPHMVELDAQPNPVEMETRLEELDGLNTWGRTS